MQKINKIIVALLLMFTLSACGNDDLGKVDDPTYNSTIATTILVEADTEKGFNFPYLLYYPSEVTGNSHLLVEAYNAPASKTSNDINFTIEEAKKYGARTGNTIGAQVAESMNLARIMPIIPRLAYIVKDSQGNTIDYGYPHGLDRTTMLIEDYIEEVYVWDLYEEIGIDDDYFEILFNLDEQILNMINDAQERLEVNKYNCEEKIFITGFSASASFSARFTSLYPTKVKAMFSGGMHLPFVPASTYENENLIYGIGGFDNEKITGNSFNLEEYNSVAKMMYIGLHDDNDPLPYDGVYTQEEKDIAISLFGDDWLSRWNKVKDVFYEVGGQGVFVESRSQAHSYTGELIDMVEDFFIENSNSDVAVYTFDCESTDLICSMP